MYLEIQTHYHVLFCRGPTFRTAFQKLGGVQAIMKAPIMALTASAPPAFEREIVNSLALDNTVVVRENSIGQTYIYFCWQKPVNYCKFIMYKRFYTR